jgi:hypothetical protein
VSVPVDTSGGAGLTAGHVDPENQAILWMNFEDRTLELISVIRGTRRKETLAQLPGSDTPQTVRLAVMKEGLLFSLYADGTFMGQRSLDLPIGEAGLVSTGPAVGFQAFQLSSETVGPPLTGNAP